MASALTALALLATLLIAPAYGTFSCTLDSSGREACTTGTQGLLEVSGYGVLWILGAVALAFVAVAAGSVLDARGWGYGRWLALVPTIGLTGLTAVSFGLGPILLLPVTLAWLAVILGFAVAARGNARADAAGS